jgi:hypothetical protein
VDVVYRHCLMSDNFERGINIATGLALDLGHFRKSNRSIALLLLLYSPRRFYQSLERQVGRQDIDRHFISSEGLANVITMRDLSGRAARKSHRSSCTIHALANRVACITRYGKTSNLAMLRYSFLFLVR